MTASGSTLAARPERPALASRPWLLGIVAGTAVGAVVALGPSPVAALGLLLGGAVALAALGRPALALPLAVAIVYSNAAVVAAQVHGAPYAVALVVPVLLLLPAAEHLLTRRAPVVGGVLLAAILAYTAVLLLTSATSRDPAASAAEVVRFATEGLIVYVLVLQGARSVAVIRACVLTLLLVGGVLGVLAILQQATGSWDQSYLGFARADGRGFAFEAGGTEVIQRRVGGPIGEQNRFAQVMLALVPLAVVALRWTRRPVLRLALLGLLVLIAAAVVLTFSRGAIVASVAVLVGLVVLGLIGRRGALAGVALALVAVVAVPGLGARLGTLDPLSDGGGGDRVIDQRINDTLAAFLAFTEHPLVGVGPGQFPQVYAEYADRVPGEVGHELYEAHSLYGEVAAEGGVLGIAAFFGLVGLTLALLLRARGLARRAGRRDLADLASGFVLVIVVHLATGLFLHLSYPRYFWLPMALAAATAVVVARDARAGAGNGARAGDGAGRLHAGDGAGRLSAGGGRAGAPPRAGTPAT
jgi:O-antigen ligase